MALVRCSCVVDLRRGDGGAGPGAARLEARVLLLDPGCAYAVHRAAADLVPVGLGDD